MPGPLRPDPRRPLLQQRRAAVQDHQVRQGDMHHRLDRLPGPLRQQPRGHQPPHRLGQRVMAALRLAPVILRPGRRRQRIQHRGHQRGALRGQVPGDDPGTAERGLHPHRPVPERLVLVLVLVVGPGAGVDLPGQPGQVRHIRPAHRRAEQDRVRVRLAVSGQLAGPPADGPGDRLRHLPGGQRRGDLRVRGRPPHPRGVPDRGAPGHMGLVDQPGPRAVIRIRGIPLAGGERGQDRGPRRRPHRGDPLQYLQALRLGLRPPSRWRPRRPGTRSRTAASPAPARRWPAAGR